MLFSTTENSHRISEFSFYKKNIGISWVKRFTFGISKLLLLLLTIFFKLAKYKLHGDDLGPALRIREEDKN